MNTSDSDITPTANEGHDGFVWSNYLRLGYAFLLAAVVAFSLAAPALAEGAVGFGK